RRPRHRRRPLRGRDRRQRGVVERTVHAYDQAETLLGQGTLGMEFAEQTAVDTVLVSVGGGGLLGGVAAWFAGAVKVVGVEPESAPTLTKALEAGRPPHAPPPPPAAPPLPPPTP